ncbi:ABC transporter substrate-binding protein [Citricoccus sp. GCM10030269]|uniref:ABC transporter substrate-binding protein n=1 Tax=Citricoccus sp. GCM10030269 TaxID=3273388 RepID=UPI003607236C
MKNSRGWRTGVRAVATAIVALLVLSGCGGQTVAGAGVGGNGGQHLVIGIESDVTAFDPQGLGSGWVSTRINQQIFDRLVTEDLSVPSEDAAQSPLVGGLAEDWKISEDGTVYTFHLREGVTFHDGTDFDAEAVEFNIRRMWDQDFEYYDTAAGGQNLYIWQYLEDLEVTGDHEIVLTLSQPFSEFLSMIAQGPTYLMSPASVEQYGQDIGEHPVGTGAFVFEDHVRGERVDLVRNDDYWGEPAKLDGVTFRPIPDASSRTSALRNDEVDMIAVPHPDSIKGLLDDGYKLSSGQPPHVWFFVFNQEDEALGNLKVRQAISHAIDREGLADDLLQGTAIPATDVQPRSSGLPVTERDEYRYDPELAKRLLAEAGYEDGLSFTLMTSVDGSGQMIPAPMAEYIQQNLEAVGIHAEIETMEWVSYLNRYTGGIGDAGMMQMSWGLASPFWIYRMLHSSQIAPNGMNVGGYANDDLDEVMEAAESSLDEDEAEEYWLEAHDIVAKDMAYLPIVHDTAPYILAPRVEGFVSPSQQWYDLSTVSLNVGD